MSLRSAFIHCFGGYRIRSLHYEAYGDAAATYSAAGGFRLEHDFSSAEPAAGCDPARLPRMFVKYRDEVEPGAIDVMAAHIFHFAEPRLGLTPAEQRVVLRALLGESDRRIAEALHLSTETVRSAWDSVYGRIARVVPAVFEGDAVEHAGRGAEKRRLAVGVSAPAPARAATAPLGRATGRYARSSAARRSPSGPRPSICSGSNVQSAASERSQVS